MSLPPTPERDDAEPETYRLVRHVEPPPIPRQRPPRPHPLRKLLLGRLPLETETSLFILINLLDFFITYYLLMHGGRGNLRFVESNPIARYYIDSWGPVKGMIGFKMTVVAFVCVVAQVIALKRVKLARLVLLIGCAAAGTVVVYSVMLWMRHS